jgi:hypothetical protein
LGLGVDAMGRCRHSERNVMFQFVDVDGRLPLLNSDGRGFDAQAVAERFGLQPVVVDAGRRAHVSGPKAVPEGGFRR